MPIWRATSWLNLAVTEALLIITYGQLSKLYMQPVPWSEGQLPTKKVYGPRILNQDPCANNLVPWNFGLGYWTGANDDSYEPDYRGAQDVGACTSDQGTTLQAGGGDAVLSFKTSFVEDSNHQGQVVDYSNLVSCLSLIRLPVWMLKRLMICWV